MKKQKLKDLGSREKLVLSVGVLVAVIASVGIMFTEPAIRNFFSTRSEIKDQKKEITKIKEADKQTGARQLEPGKAIIYMYNYVEGITQKSGVKYKNFQASGTSGVAGSPSKGMANFQLKLGSNAWSFAKLLFLAENTVPSVSITSFRISSIAGGTLEGMRQLDTLAAVAISTSRLGGKTFFADENKLKPLRRDPFAPYEKKAPPVRKVVKEAESPQVEPLPPAESWTLTAAMSDPSSEGDTLLFKKGSGSMKYALTLKKGGDITLSWSGEKVEIKIGEKQMLWTLGETVSEEDIPKKLVEAIKNNVLLKSENAPVPEASVSTAVQENASSEDGLSEEELGKMGITKEMVKQLPTEQLRMFRGRRNR